MNIFNIAFITLISLFNQDNLVLGSLIAHSHGQQTEPCILQNDCILDPTVEIYFFWPREYDIPLFVMDDSILSISEVEEHPITPLLLSPQITSVVFGRLKEGQHRLDVIHNRQKHTTVLCCKKTKYQKWLFFRKQSKILCKWNK